MVCPEGTITEAEERSGSQITIDCALEQNRNVYVLPGSMFNKMTKGNLRRINERCSSCYR